MAPAIGSRCLRTIATIYPLILLSGTNSEVLSSSSAHLGSLLHDGGIIQQDLSLKQEEKPTTTGAKRRFLDSSARHQFSIYQFEVSGSEIVNAEPSAVPSEKPSVEPSEAPTIAPTLATARTSPYLKGDVLEASEASAEPSSEPSKKLFIFEDQGHFLPVEALQGEGGGGGIENREPGSFPNSDLETVNTQPEQQPNPQGEGGSGSNSYWEQPGDPPPTGDPPEEQSTGPVQGDEADQFVPVQEGGQNEVTLSSEAPSGPTYYYVDLLPFSVFVDASRDLTTDLSIPLYLLIEMQETFANLVDVKISNLTIQMGVVMTTSGHGHNHPDEIRARNADPTHFHWNHLFFHGKAEFEDSVVYPEVTVQNIQTLVLSDEASLQNFWDTQGIDQAYGDIVLQNITVTSPDEIAATTPAPTPAPSVAVAQQEDGAAQPQEQEEQDQSTNTTSTTENQSQSQSTEPEDEEERSSNVWVMVPLVVIFLMICFCIILLCGRLQYLANRAQDKYNEKYGLDYNVYGDRDLGKDIFKEEYLASEHDHEFSNNGLSDSLRSLEYMTRGALGGIKSSVRRSSKAKIKAPTNDEISTETDDDEVHVSFKTTPEVRQEAPSPPPLPAALTTMTAATTATAASTPNSSHVSHEAPLMAAPMVAAPMMMMAPPSRNSSKSSLRSSQQGGSQREIFNDESGHDQALAPPSVADVPPRRSPEPDIVVTLAAADGLLQGSRSHVSEGNLLNLSDHAQTPTPPPLPRSVDVDAEAATGRMIVSETPTRDNRSPMPVDFNSSANRSIGSGSGDSSSYGPSVNVKKRRGSKRDMGNSSGRGDRGTRSSFKSMGSLMTAFGAGGEDKSGVMGNSSERRSTRSNRSIRSDSSMSSFYSCQGDLV